MRTIDATDVFGDGIEGIPDSVDTVPAQETHLTRNEAQALLSNSPANIFETIDADDTIQFSIENDRTGHVTVRRPFEVALREIQNGWACWIKGDVSQVVSSNRERAVDDCLFSAAKRFAQSKQITNGIDLHTIFTSLEWDGPIV